MAKVKRPNGYVIYDGPSPVDNAPIVGIITGVTNPSDNPKTGPMVQLWILRKDVYPSEAVREGKDESICGKCIFRAYTPEGKKQVRKCYVNIKGPDSVWTAYKRGNYPEGDYQTIVQALAGKGLRLGAYGDPALLPFDVVQGLVRLAKTHTGYTHQWRTIPEAWASLVMASADSASDREMANAKGYRTFRVRREDEALGVGEINCPYPRTQCVKCGLCNGKATDTDKRKDIAIEVHGQAAKRFEGGKGLTNAYATSNRNTGQAPARG